MYLFFRIEVAWEPAPPAAPAMATIGPLLLQRRFAEARPLLETLLQLQPEHPEASTTWDSSPAKRAGWRRPGCWSDLALACLIHVGMVPQARVAVAAAGG
jgi:hypothetical protein